MDKLRAITVGIGATCVLTGILVAENTAGFNTNTEMVILSLSSILFGGFMLTLAMLIDGRTYR